MSNGKQVGYLRASNVAQNTLRQLQDIKLGNILENKNSGKDINRPHLQTCLEYLREDTLDEHPLARRVRSVEDLLAIARNLTDWGITAHLHMEHLILNSEGKGGTSIFHLMLAVLGATTECSAALHKKKPLECVSLAKTTGRYKDLSGTITQDMRDEMYQLNILACLLLP